MKVREHTCEQDFGEIKNKKMTSTFQMPQAFPQLWMRYVLAWVGSYRISCSPLGAPVVWCPRCSRMASQWCSHLRPISLVLWPASYT